MITLLITLISLVRSDYPIVRSDYPSRTTDEQLGVSPGAAFLWLDDAQLNWDMAAIVRSGAKWVRVDVDWSSIEVRPGSIDWSATDRVIRAARWHGLRVLGLLSYTPEWARPPGTTTHAPPLEADNFAQFAGSAAAHYRNDVEAWEIWNEPNVAQFWEPRPDPNKYATLLRLASNAVRAADADTTVLTGGLAPAETNNEEVAPVQFLEAVYDAVSHGAFDAVAVHPYSYPELPADPRSACCNAFGSLSRVHQVMAANDDGDAEIWLTEFGAPTGSADGAVSPKRQARILAEGLTQARKVPWIGPVFIYALRDTGIDPADREQNFGVLDAGGAPKPAWDVLMAAAARRMGER